jgi:P4 family phage/plasmid primase-like protien
MSSIKFTLSLDGAQSKVIFDRTPETLLKSLLSDCYQECYELIPIEGWIRPYFDIELKKGKCEHETGVSFEESYERRYDMLEYIQENLTKTFGGGDIEWAVCEASKEGEIISFHMTIPNRKTTMKDMRNISRAFKFPLDKKVYLSKTAQHPRKFRTLYSLKHDGTRPLIPLTHKENETELLAHFISVVDEDAATFTAKETSTAANNGGVTMEIMNTKKDGSGIGAKLIQTDDRNEWFKIGVSLLALFGEEQAKKEFLDYSSRHPSHDESIFDKTWRDIVARRYSNGGWGLIQKYLDPSDHEEFMSASPPLHKNDKDIAEWVLNNFTKYAIVCDGLNWYRFVNHCWRRCQEEEVSKDLFKFVANAYESVLLRCPVEDSERREVCRKAYDRACSLTFITTLIKTVRIMVIDGDFTDRLDQNRYLLGFCNGVLDLRTKTFRPGRPDDYISLSMGYDFSQDYDEQSMESLKNILLQICCEDKEKMECLLRIFARAMVGNNSVSHQRFYCMYGRGANGKAVLEGLLRNTFGEYFTIAATSLLTQSEQRADGANADVASLIGRRFVVMSETQEGVRFNTQTLKKHTGDESICYRNLYAKTIKNTLVTWTQFLMTNDRAKLSQDDKGTMRRFVYFHLRARFEKDADAVLVSQDEYSKVYERDETLLSRIHSFKYAFLHLLLEHLIVDEAVPLSKDIIQETESLIKSQDLLLDILTQSFEAVGVNEVAEGGLPYGVSWQDMKRLLEQQHRDVFRELKARKPDGDLFAQVKARLPYAKAEIGSNRALPYFDQTKGKVQSRRVFLNIRPVEQEPAW